MEETKKKEGFYGLSGWMVFSAFVTSATPRTPAGGRACGTPSPMGDSVFRPRFIRAGAGALGFERFPPLTSVNFTGSRFLKMPWLVLPAPSGPRAKKKRGADHRPRARQWPGDVRRGTGGASNCTNGFYYGPAPCDSEIGPNRRRARFRAMASSRRPRHRPRDFQYEIKHANGRPGGWGRGKVGLRVGDAPESRSAARVHLGATGESSWCCLYFLLGLFP